jgi:acyl transferase domain-containing protein/NAD(P)H-dependent flavin oxidoreductase YrpB (nitropropane dioxygenase family)/NAD(P)-dependent dehydrogenase (short-subunit alcohol dehydrogenase family)
MSSFGIIALTPVSFPGDTAAISTNPNDPNAALTSPHYGAAFAAKMAGEAGLINLELHELTDEDVAQRVTAAVVKLSRKQGGRYGIKYGARQSAEALGILLQASRSNTAAQNSANSPLVIISSDVAGRFENLDEAVKNARSLGATVLAEVTSLKEALAAKELPVDGLVAKGSEAGGVTSETTAFILLQEITKVTKLPVWVQGGIGLYSAAACLAAGARGVVLDAQLLLARESALPTEIKQRIATMDGTEITSFAAQGGKKVRVFARQGHPLTEENIALKSLSDLGAYLPAPGQKKKQDALELKREDMLLAVGQDIALAKQLADKFVSVSGIIEAIKESAQRLAELAGEQNALKPGGALAESHKTKYPIVQGAMTRVSDTAEFALKVAEGGGLPFLALALMRGEEAEVLVAKTKQMLGDKPWGVGVLGFVPQELRQEQFAVINRHKPPFALIAGGRPDQAKSLEDTGISTYLHVPSPILLSSFIEMGARRFIFEGRECGGHVGPRSSFVLWEQMVEILASVQLPKAELAKLHILMAGGIHDGLSAAMVAAMTASLTERGMKVGVLIGTAYLFTKEAVETGAIVEKFQEAAIACKETVLLETGPGHAIRCINSPYKRIFDDKRVELVLAEKTKDEVREELELMNLGRLRIASKGVTRPAEKSASRESILSDLADSKNKSNGENARKKLVEVSKEEQWQDGMYMIGQVASMHERVLTIEELHQSVSQGSLEVLKQAKESETKAAQTSHLILRENARPRRDGWDNVAIVGMSCMFPKANDLAQYWQNILSKVDAIEEVPADQWDWRNYYDEDSLARDKICSKWGGFLKAITFDPTKYGIPPSSLNSIDPMQLMLLEITDRALEDAGYKNRPFGRKNTSVILANAGHGPVTALMSLRSMLGWKLAHLDDAAKVQIADILPEWTEDSFAGYLGNVAAGRVANRFDLGGINFSIDAACASSLAALYTSVRELRAGTSDVVFLAAADTHNQPGDYLSFSKTHAFSKTGHCRTFDATADGIVISEGVAMLVLKRLEDAEHDGDRIYAVVRGVGGSSDGRDLSLTAPRPEGQMLALTRAYEDAGISPASVTLVEAHGTGTVAGDRAEIEALKQVFESSGAEKRNCAVGSVKTMIGHTKAAAGLASLIKVAKALHHKVLPPTLGVTVPNPSCDFENSPFYINSEVRPWLHATGQENNQRRAGVSAFGFGGTNFHCVLEEYEPSCAYQEEPCKSEWPAELFAVSAATRMDMVKSVQQLLEIVKRAQADAISNTPGGFTRFAHKEFLKSQLKHSQKSAANSCRLTIVAESFGDLIEKLKRAQSDLLSPQKTEFKDPRGVFFKERSEAGVPGKIAFLFPGQGSQQVNMLSDLSVAFPCVRKTFEQAEEAVKGILPRSLNSYIFPPPAFAKETEEKYQQELTDTRIAQPAVGAAGMAAFHLLSQLGIKADCTAGHSYGEYVALSAAGVMSLKELIRISELRGRLLSASVENDGTMAAVTAQRQDVEKLLSTMAGITLANINAPNQCVISGATDAVNDAVSAFKNQKIAARTIAVSQAFHSQYMEHAREPLKKALQSVTMSAPRVPTYSNTDANQYSSVPEEIVNRLVEHIVKPVDFVSQIKRMQQDGAYFFIEVGPGSVLTNLASSILKDSPHLAVAIDRTGKNGIIQLLNTLAQLWSHGVEFDARVLYEGRIEQIPQPYEQSTVGPNSKPKLLYLMDSQNISRANGTTTTPTAKAMPQAQARPQVQTQVQPQGQTQSPIPGQTQNGQPQVQTQPQGKPVSSSPQTGAVNGASTPTQAVQNNLGQPQFENGTNPAAKESATRMTASTTNPTKPANLQSGSASTPRAPQAAAANNLPAAYPQQQLPRQAAGGNVDQVMIQFQQTMLEMTNSFLKTQQQVMSAYLQAKSGAVPPQGQWITQQQQFIQPQIEQQQFVQPYVQPQFTQPQFAQPQIGQQQFVQPYAQPQFPQPQFAQRQYPEYVQPVVQTQYEQPVQVQPEYIQNNGHEPITAQITESPAIMNTPISAESNGKNGAHNETNGAQGAVQAVVQAQTTAQPQAPISNEKLVEELLDIVSQRTGYPPEMLDPELDLEADLGIDSIKRVEILNSFRKILPESKQRELEGGLEQLAGTKTLKGIIDWINSDASADAGSNGSALETNGKGATELISEISGSNGFSGTPGSDGSLGSLGAEELKESKGSEESQESQESQGSNGANGANGTNGNGNGAAHDIVVIANAELTAGGNGNGGNGNGNGHDTFEKAPAAAAAQTGFASRKESASGHNIKRATVEVSQLSLPVMEPTKVPQGSIDLIIADEGDAWQEVGKSLTARGEKCVVIRHVANAKEGLKINNGACELDATSFEAVQAVVQSIKKSHGKVARIVDLQPLNKADSAITGNVPPASLITLLNFAKAAYADLNDPAHKGIATITSASKLGGSFGSSGSGAASETVAGLNRVWGAGISGFMKCLAKEWPNVRVKAVDFEQTLLPSQIAKLVLTEMDAQEELEENEGGGSNAAVAAQKRVEIGYVNDGTARVGLNVKLADIEISKSASQTPAISIDSSSVIVITGGARGITAEIALDLAEQFQPQLILIGRTPEPAAEPSYTAGLTSMRDLKAAIMEQLKQSGQQVSIAFVESQYQKLLRDREIRDNLQAMRAAGSKVEYLPVDVRDDEAFESAIELIVTEFGKIDGIIHGAGVIEDAFVKEKAQASFERVFTTKVNSARTLSKLAKGQDLKFMFLFSSVVGRTGNAGQCDYVSANEVLNKLAVTLNRSSSARVASIMWGPWNAGMAQPELESLFAKYGWAMIAPTAGRKAFVEDLLYGQKDQAELVIVAQLPASTGVPTDKTVRLQDAYTRQLEDGTCEFDSVLSPDVDLYLQDHTFDGVPVMPMAMALEMMAEAAQALCPEMKMTAVNRLEIPAGIVFDSASKTITVSARKTDAPGQTSLVEAVVLTGNKRQHFKTSFELSGLPANGSVAVHRMSGLVSIPSFVPTTATMASIAQGIKSMSTLPTRQTVYTDYMFHGPLFQGIVGVSALGEEGIVGELKASKPQACLSRSTGTSEWTIDPILLDSAMQLAGVWARQFLDITVLPTGFKKLHLGDRDLMLADSYFARVFITPGTTARELTCDVAVYTKAGDLAFVIEGLGGIGSKSLNRLSNQANQTNQSTSIGGTRS